MKCVNPRRLPNPKATGVNDAFIQTSCGKCYACLANRRRSWLFRLENEHLDSIFSLFVTFTYDDDNCDGLLHKEHLQNYWKKLRHHDSITYYAIGEFGTTTFRPHYHALIFFKSASNVSILEYYELIDRLWPFGFTAPCRVNYRRINYVLHYHIRPKEPLPGLKTFQVFSKGLGIGFLDDNIISYMVDTKSTTIRDYNGCLYVIPRYYRKKLIELGYDIEAPIKYDEDYSVKRIEKVFQKPIYEIPQTAVVNFLHHLVNNSKNKLNKYNNQDKFI